MCKLVRTMYFTFSHTETQDNKCMTQKYTDTKHNICSNTLHTERHTILWDYKSGKEPEKSVYHYLGNTSFHQWHGWLNTPVFNRLYLVMHQLSRLDKEKRTRVRRDRGLKQTHTLKWVISDTSTDCSISARAHTSTWGKAHDTCPFTHWEGPWECVRERKTKSEMTAFLLSLLNHHPPLCW